MSVPFSENGGFAASTFFLMMPVQTSDLGLVYVGIFDVSNFDDPVDPSTYSYRQEDVAICRVPTVRRVLLIYRDLGQASLTVTLTGVDDNDAAVTASKVVPIGTTSASGKLLTRLVDVEITASRPQLSYRRSPGGGPISIVSATMVGEVEEVTL